MERAGYQSVESVGEAGSWSVEVERVGYHSVESVGEAGSWSVEVERVGYHSVESVGEAGSWSVEVERVGCQYALLISCNHVRISQIWMLVTLYLDLQMFLAL